MNLRMRKSVATVAVVVGAGMGLSACGSDDEAPGSSGDTAAVGEEADVELTEENFFEEVAAAQIEAGTAQVAMSLGAEGQAVEADGAIALGEGIDDTAIQMTLSLGGQDAELRLVDSVLYMNIGPMTENKFLEVDLEDESNPLGEQLGSLQDSFDPAQQLAAVEDAITGFEQAGETEELDGVETTPYEITVDGAKILEDSGLADQPGAEGLTDQIGEITYTMFVGPDNLVRRITTDVAGASTQVDYTAWGEDVTIEKPADSEISDMDPSQLGTAGSA